jgi:hypothetical protein
MQTMHVGFMRNRSILVKGSKQYVRQPQAWTSDAVLHEKKLPDSRHLPLEKTLNRIHAAVAEATSHHKAERFVYVCRPRHI